MKKYISLLLSLVFVLSLGACTGSSEEDDGKALETADSYIDMQTTAVLLTLRKTLQKHFSVFTVLKSWVLRKI